MSKPSMYIRAKREKTVLFLCTDPTDSVDEIKTKLCQALDNKKTNDEVRLLVEDKSKSGFAVLENPKSLENNGVVYFVYFDKNEGEWENVNVVEPELLDDDMEEDEVSAPPTSTKKEKGKGRA
ncbi:hypothetical protein EDC96DRAFT_60315 [Choanephora cucurbitarum]|nr:hypothetical protein EDC96DRAFT_60315 [Choanephora cucurbitarum]